ncbi:MAG: undecaprenyl-phosphate galactose phosphotransferase WbaP [Phycisphaeraceae bacterium]
MTVDTLSSPPTAPQMPPSEPESSPEPIAAQSLKVTQRVSWTMAALVLSDLIALSVANVVIVMVRYIFGGEFDPAMYLALWPVLAAFITLFAFMQTYSVPLNPPQETRQVCVGIALVYLGLGSVSFLLRTPDIYSRLIFLAACPAAVFAVLLGRSLTRMLLGPKAWWGRPAVLVGCGRVGRRLIRTLSAGPELGIKPVGILSDHPWRHRGFRDVAFLGGTEQLARLAKENPSVIFIVIAADLTPSRVQDILQDEQKHVQHLVLAPDLSGVRSIEVFAQDYGGVLGLRVHHRLLDRRHMLGKRLIDLSLVLLLAPLLLLLMSFIALLIKLNSRGPVLFKHQRIGRGGTKFNCLKFRTMIENHEQVFKDYLAANPDAALEWEKEQKLRHDPRVTAIGRFLRRTSLDELPQVINVLVGQMSLVGPRPIIESEVIKYGDCFELYKRVRPGITGLWQVCGRNNLRYSDRVWLDEHYVRNWSVWMDMFILSRTGIVVVLGRGAY